MKSNDELAQEIAQRYSISGKCIIFDVVGWHMERPTYYNALFHTHFGNLEKSWLYFAGDLSWCGIM